MPPKSTLPDLTREKAEPQLPPQSAFHPKYPAKRWPPHFHHQLANHIDHPRVRRRITPRELGLALHHARSLDLTAIEVSWDVSRHEDGDELGVVTFGAYLQPPDITS